MHPLAASLSCLLLAAVVTGPTATGGKAAPIIEHGPRDAKRIALTFDACPTSHEDDEYDSGVIEVLKRENVPATLFMSGRWVEKNEAIAKLLASDPLFEIANHCYWHSHLLEKDDVRVLRELARTQAVIRNVTGKRPKYFRPPFGEVDGRVANLAAKAGLVTIQYDIASGDPDPGLSAERIVRGVVAQARSGSIVVFHMNGNGVHTDEVLPVVIKELRKKGYELVTVGELLQGMDTGMRGRGDTEKRPGKGRKGGPVQREVPKVWQSAVCH